MTYQVTIEPTGDIIDVEEGQTILDAALRNGVWLPFACGHGTCATCKCQVLEGDYDVGNASPFALMDMERRTMQILTQTSLDESPSISPNGAMLLYATKYRGKGILAAVSLDGGVKFRLPSQFGEVREPAWSPYLK